MARGDSLAKDIQEIIRQRVTIVNSKRCYLAGPMRGIEEYNFPAFHAAAADLRARGWEVFSPAEKDESEGFNPKTDEARTLAEYMEGDLPAVCRAEAVIVLPGWERSAGARIETSVAAMLGKPVLLYPELVEESVLAEADRLVSGERQADYGHPLDDFEKVVGMATALWGRGPESAEEHALYMLLVKIAREANRHKRDNLTDIGGYAKTLALVHEERARRAA